MPFWNTHSQFNAILKFEKSLELPNSIFQLINLTHQIWIILISENKDIFISLINIETSFLNGY